MSKFLPFEQARAYIRTLGIKSQKEWSIYSKSGQRPDDIPSNPQRVYKQNWQSWANWLGTEYLPFQEAQAYVQTLGLKNLREWRAYCQSGRKPRNIPVNPNTFYQGEFESYGIWLGTQTVATQKREYLPFEEARAYVWTLQFRNEEEWRKYCTSGLKPANIPSCPYWVYKTEWQGERDWLGIDVNELRRFLSFEEAREYARSLGFKTRLEWDNHCKSGAKPTNIPSNPYVPYKQNWKSWGNWLGTKRVANQRRVFLPFEEAREYIHGLNIRNQKEWHTYSRSGDRPSSIPADPQNAYKGQFKGWGDFLGTGNLGNEARRVTPEHKQGVRKAVNQRRRARKLDVQGTYTPEQILAQFKRQKGRCYYAACGFSKFQKDSTRAFGYAFDIEHTFPLARVAGSDIPANTIDYIVLACDSCNGKKKDKFPWEWFEGGRLL